MKLISPHLLPSSVRTRFLLATLVCIQLVAYSLPAHKEFRFLLPALQLAMPYCGVGAAYLIEEGQRKTKNVAVAAASFASSSTVRKNFAVSMLGLQVPITLFFSMYHQRAQVQVMRYLQTSQSTSSLSVLFLTPCHTTPYYSYIHKAIPMRFLDCSPPGILGSLLTLCLISLLSR
jgi:phosphatidylinositol glycan class B